MKIIKNYKGGNLKEKVCKILFKYKGSMTIVSANDRSLNKMITLFEKTDEVDILCNAEFILEQLGCFDEKFKNGCEISEIEKQIFGISVYFLTKSGIFDNDADNGMVVFIE